VTYMCRGVNISSPLETGSEFAQSVIPDERHLAARDPWFDRPFDRLTVLSKVEGLITLSEVEGESSESSMQSFSSWTPARPVE